jgi:large-conductance mechanosensitive channel
MVFFDFGVALTAVVVVAIVAAIVFLVVRNSGLKVPDATPTTTALLGTSERKLPDDEPKQQ